MRRLVTIVILCIGCLMTASAQTFTQRIQIKEKAGEGSVTITQDKAIDELVNGKAGQQEEKKADEATTAQKTEIQRLREQILKRDTSRDTILLDTPTIDTRKKVMRGGVKVNGYRVQAFAGGNQRKDRQQAERIGNTIKASYPHEPIYVHFYSPRWICRVGNYRTYEEAHEMLLNIRKLGISGASIVKGKITVQY